MIAPRTASAFSSRRRTAVSRAADLLREHPLFDIPVPGAEVPPISPEDREEAWARETLQLLQRRVRFLWLAMLCALPGHWLFYVYLTHSSAQDGGVFSGQSLLTTLAEGLMALACTLLYSVARRTQSSSLIKSCAFLAYVLFAVTASTVMALAPDNDGRALVLSGHPQLVVALLFMPFSVTEAGLCALLIVSLFGAGLSAHVAPGELAARLTSISLSGVLVLVMMHLQGIGRRRAFDAAFDMALSATRGANLSNSDFLTGGANRRHFEAVVSVELERCIRHQRPLALILFDLDSFKAINDTFGHASGDEILCEIFRAAQDTVRASDVLARWGGDEFALALIETDCKHAARTAERLRDAVKNRLNSIWGEDSLHARVTLSIGIACLCNDEPVPLAKLIDQADAALYQSKREGKNRVTVG